VELLANIGRLFTATRAGVLTDAAVVVDGARIAWVGPTDGVPADLREAVTEIYDVAGALMTPGLIDSHTHPVYADSRLEEVALRSAGASDAELAAMGGINATVTATKATDAETLEALVTTRLRWWLVGGTTTVEAKTGYHLDQEGELFAVRLLTSLLDVLSLPDLMVTFFGAHAVPPESSMAADAYADWVATWCPAARAAGARFCDVVCDEGYFTVEQSRRILEAGRRAGLIPRIHADELARTGGAELAASLGAASADHLLYINEGDARRLAEAGVVATLTPCTAVLAGHGPPVRPLKDAGVMLALGTDHNPATCGTTSMSLVIALGVAALGLSVEEALLAATRGGAFSLRLDDRGQVRPGLRADLVAWDAEHEGALAWAFGLRPLHVWLGGTQVVPSP
jgi:imidazolonepropionase